MRLNRAILKVVGWLGLTTALSPASSASALDATTPAYKAADLKNYAQALVAMTRIETSLAERSDQAPQTARADLKHEADAQIARVLSRHEFSVGSFNAMSSRIEQQPLLMQEVRQDVAEEQIGY